MIEILGYVLIGLGIVLGLAGSIAAMFGLYFIAQLKRKQADDLKDLKTYLESLGGKQEEFRLNLKDTLERLQTFLIEFDGALRASIKGGFDNQIEASEKVIDASVEISNKNSQTLMDTLTILAQMMNLVLKGLGYEPARSIAEPGLEEPKGGQNYNAPPAPSRKKKRKEDKDDLDVVESGLIYSKK